MELSIIIVSFNTKKLLIDCLESIKKYVKNIKFEVIIVDNASKDGSAEIDKNFINLNLKTIKNKENLGFAAANNQGAKIAKGKYILFLNSDTYFISDMVKDMIAWMEKRPKVAATSCKLLNKDWSTQGTGGYFPSLIRVFSWMTIQDIPGVDMIIKPFHPAKSKFTKNNRFFNNAKQLDWLTGAFVLIRKSIFEEVKGFDEGYHMYTEDTDLFFKIKKLGYQIWYLPQWEIVHLGGKSSTSEFPVLAEYRGIKRFYKKHYPTWQMPILRLIIKIGALGRIVLFGIIEGPESAKTYAKAFQIA